MTEPPSNVIRAPRIEPIGRPAASERTGDAPTAASRADLSAAASIETQPRRDELILSEAARQADRTESFDRAKVEAIKDAIRNGQYPLDSRRIAESFYAIERMISD